MHDFCTESDISSNIVGIEAFEQGKVASPAWAPGELGHLTLRQLQSSGT